MHWEQSEFISDKHCVMEHLKKLSYLLRTKESTHDQILNPDKHKTRLFQDKDLSFESMYKIKLLKLLTAYTLKETNHSSI